MIRENGLSCVLLCIWFIIGVFSGLGYVLVECVLCYGD